MYMDIMELRAVGLWLDWTMVLVTDKYQESSLHFLEVSTKIYGITLIQSTVGSIVLSTNQTLLKLCFLFVL